ncbi:hypothetical protein [Lactobacillus sp. PV037]|uniref:hypothetical protein n=1 Tax=Lactobacillus sp. PV037 TaxID=2594496 RepID=UPI00223F0321|nr:hypothetical protein [Lactobacillus sp. PV037]
MSKELIAVIADKKIKDYFTETSFNKKLDDDFKERLFEETFLENKTSMDWLKDK